MMVKKDYVISVRIDEKSGKEFSEQIKKMNIAMKYGARYTVSGIVEYLIKEWTRKVKKI